MEGEEEWEIITWAILSLSRLLLMMMIISQPQQQKQQKKKIDWKIWNNKMDNAVLHQKSALNAAFYRKLLCAYLKQCLINFCIDWYLDFVEFLIKLRTMVVDIINGDNNTCSRRQLRYSVVR